MIIIHKKAPMPEKKYKVPEVAKATGLSEGQVSGFFNNRIQTTKDGLTIEQIEEVCRGKKRQEINWRAVDEIRRRLLDERGIEIVETDEIRQEEMAL